MLDALFISVLNMSLIGSYAIVFVLAAGLLLKKAPKIYSYALWGIVLFRLLCPISFESGFSLLPTGGAPLSQDIIYSTAPQINTGSGSVDHAINSILPRPNMGDSVNPLQIWLSIATVIWAIGMLAMLVYSVAALVRLRRSLIGATQLKENIYLTDHLAAPFVMGLFKPKIYLPSALSDSERAFITAHEMCHIRRFDHVTRILAFAAFTIHWFNPLVWLAFFVSGKEMELSCDEAVMRKMNSDIRTEYSQLLLRFGTAKKRIPATPLAFGEGDTKSRVKNVLNYKKPAFWVMAVSVIAVAAMVVGLAANPKNQPLPIPEMAEITRIGIEQINEGESLGLIETGDQNQIKTILKTLQNTNQTRQTATIDAPARKDYFQIEIHAAEPMKLYLYHDENRYYVEAPDMGIYKTSRETSLSIAAVYTSNGGADAASCPDLRPMILVNDVLYLDTNKEVLAKIAASAVLGKITSAAATTAKPTENGQCNFNSGVGATYAAYEDGMAVFLDDKWFFFEEELKSAAPPAEVSHDQAVTSALFALGHHYAKSECFSEGHIILGYEDSDQNKIIRPNHEAIKTKLYALTTIGGYSFENNNFVEVSGAAFPAVITLFNDQHVEIEQPLDGSDYTASLKKMFPKEYHARLFKYDAAAADHLKQQKETYAREYLAKIGRQAKIGDDSDFEYTSLTDAGVTVEVSHHLQDFYKAHYHYPDFIGTRERLENGVRLVYETSYAKNQAEIRFTKYDYDTKQIAEQFIADAKTGNIME